MGTIASNHWDETSGDNSALPTSQQCSVIPTTALMMTHINNYSEKDPFPASRVSFCLSGTFPQMLENA
jgi:hypothetical protein